jgi:2-methylisocitrate lyase-like PEP mutase family enzyme
VAAVLGYEDDERAPSDEMLAAAARIAASVEVPVTVDAEAGYGMEPGAVVAALREAGAAGCNLEDTDHAAGSLHDAERHAEWLGAVRQAASDDGYPLVMNARVDVFIWPYLAATQEEFLPETVRRTGVEIPESQDELVAEAVRRARLYLEAGADCVYPIILWEPDALRGFMSEITAPVNVARMPEGPPVAELAAAGVARVSWGPFLHFNLMARFKEQLAALD